MVITALASGKIYKPKFLEAERVMNKKPKGYVKKIKRCEEVRFMKLVILVTNPSSDLTEVLKNEN